MKNEFIKRNHEEVQSKSGKFVENVFRALNFIITKNALIEIKSNEMNKISEKLKKADSSKHSESVRLLMPDIALSLIYQPRSKLGSVHQKPITPDYIDAKLTVEASNWIMAEFLRQYGINDVEKVSGLINNIVKEHVPIIQKINNEIFVDADITCDEEILIRLHESLDGLTRNEFGKAISNFASSTITNSLSKLKRSRSIFLTSNEKYIIAESGRRRINKRMIEMSSKATCS